MATAPNPLPPADARAMFGHIAGKLGNPKDNACDHTQRHARGWCEANGVDWPAARDWLRSTGGYCDCEVLMNSAAHMTGEA